ncbi:MAG: CHAT domain-containing protein, partial [Saprospiraceae bacterium]|nr:CHAT domain-containing protein [Saprospiraceae bacterium]
DAHPNYASSLNSLGNIYFELDDFKNAETYYKQAMEIRKKALGDAHPGYASSLNDLGNLYSTLGDFRNAEIFYKQAIEIRKNALGDANLDYAGSLNNLGILHKNFRNYKSAEPLFKNALQLYTAKYGSENPNVELILSNLSWLYTAMGEFNTAEQYYKESFKIKLENINSDFSWLSANEKIAYWNQENKFFFDLGYFSYKAWKELNSSTELTYNASLVSKSLLLETSRELEQAISNSSDEVMKNQFKEMKQLLKFYNKIQSEGSANKEMALNYKRQADSLDKILVNKLGVYADSKRKFKITWKDVQSNLGSTEAAIEFVRFYKDSLYNYMALVVRPEYEYPKLVKLGDELAIQAAVQSKDYASLYNLAWKGIDSLLEGVQRVYYSPSGELNNVSFSAICLQNGNDLVISSQNANRGMIIGSKITTKTDCKTVLMDKYELHQLTSTRYLADGTLQKEKTVQQSLVILGGINYDEKPEQTSKEEREQTNENEDYALMNNLNQMVNRNSTNYGKRMEYLSGTNEEVIIIENLLNNSKWKVQTRSDKSAGEYEFKKEMESKSPGVLHVATHGFAFPEEIKKEGKMMELNQTSTYKIAEDPMVRCGLMLSGSNISWTGNPQRMIEQTGDDGILTAAEVANMDLSNTKLVVLSACETGLGKIEGSEGTFGLKRGFKLAGVEQLVVSLWSVPDKETMELMTMFYSDLTQSLNPVSSFEKAQKEMRLKYPTDLEKWAGFVLVR